MTELSELYKERRELALIRLKEIASEGENEPLSGLEKAWEEYALTQAKFLLRLNDLIDTVDEERSEAEWKRINSELYDEIRSGRYETCFANPVYASKRFGEGMGRLLSAVAAEMRSAIPAVFEQDEEDLLLRMELFLEIHTTVDEWQKEWKGAQKETEIETDTQDLEKAVKSDLYWYVSDYSEIAMEKRIAQMVDPAGDFAVKIVCESDLSDPGYLYRYGEYITDNELELAKHIQDLPEETVKKMADTFTEGYRIGFKTTGKDISLKKTVNIRYPIGMERMVRMAIGNFKAIGLEPVIYRATNSLLTGRSVVANGYFGAFANQQYEYDHREDEASVWDGQLATRKLECTRNAYEKYRDLAKVHGGPAVIETFGDVPFVPASCPQGYRYSEKQQENRVQYRVQAGKMTNTYIPGEERSFTIIAFPVPAIGDRFKEIFDAVTRINTLDYMKYSRIQQALIDTLDKAVEVHVTGRGGNRTDLRVALCEIKDPAKETHFENCVADVNIPVGEVFTSPKLKGTNGILHVGHVYLNELEFRDLSVTFEDGMVADYDCGNFETEEENRRYFEENVLFHHKTLPMGECAIGTNTTAYVMAKKYGIEDRLPILIAEKTGPHFAVGDTCYSHAEDIAVFNPDGKEIISRDNEISLLRKTDESKAYFQCHTDITIPYDELGAVFAVMPDGEEVALIRDGRFVLPGTEELNEPFERAQE